MTGREDTTTLLTIRQRLGLHILAFMLRMVNPTGYVHEVDQLKEQLFGSEGASDVE